jgi:D-alanyl-lipoteichoic acid acyltransferase DltB (MBOAT superfamily)
VRNGLRLVIYGLFLKVAVADNLASVVDTFYSDHTAYTQAEAWLATFYFTFQVYTDFFGYSLLAQGSALLFGIHLMDNFNKPFIAKSIPEFWQRWHISLSTWFRDYIFIPVGGNKRGPWVLAMAAMLVFFTSGLWHGANGTMIAFGVAQGLLYLFDRFVFKKLEFVGGHFHDHQGRLPLRRRLWDGFRTVKTGFFFMMTLVWFRSATMDQASEVFGMLWMPGYINCRLDGLVGIAAPTLAHGLQIPLFLCIFLLLDLWVMKDRADVWLGKFPMVIRWAMYVSMAVSIWIWGGAVNHPFVYFQF